MPQAKSTPGAKFKILIIEDDEYSREAYVHLLDAEGYMAEAADGGIAGLTKAREMHPDAIVLDLTLTDMHGNEFIERLREDPSLHSIPILVVTGREDEEARSAIDAGAAAYLIKPIEFSDLLRAISDLPINRKL